MRGCRGGGGAGDKDVGVLLDPEELEGLTQQEQQHLLEVGNPLYTLLNRFDTEEPSLAVC